jgi:4-hydroxy-2-oxoheptanedioate aldolase
MGPDFVWEANEQVLAIVMIEDVGAVRELDAILEIEGLDGVCIGPSDLSGALGHFGDTRHPDVQRTVDTIIKKALDHGLYLGVGIGTDVAVAREWIDRGVQWVQLGVDFMYLRERWHALSTAAHAR